MLKVLHGTIDANKDQSNVFDKSLPAWFHDTPLIHGIFPFHKNVLYSGKSLQNVLHTRKNRSFKICSLIDSLGNPKWILYGITVKSPVLTFIFKSEMCPQKDFKKHTKPLKVTPWDQQWTGHLEHQEFSRWAAVLCGHLRNIYKKCIVRILPSAQSQTNGRAAWPLH